MVNSIDFGAAAAVVVVLMAPPVMVQLMMELRDGFRCHGIEQRTTTVEDGRMGTFIDCVRSRDGACIDD